jgi:aminoglycoside/choline kinase family phosphotransferase
VKNIHEYLKKIFKSEIKCEELHGDASTRKYYRVFLNPAHHISQSLFRNNSSVILCIDFQQSKNDEMSSLEKANGIITNNNLNQVLIEKASKKPNFLNSTGNRFIFWSEYLKKMGINVPEIYSVEPTGCIWLEDLGGKDLTSHMNFTDDRKAVKLLRQIHSIKIPESFFKIIFFRQKKITYELCFLLHQIKQLAQNKDDNYPDLKKIKLFPSNIINNILNNVIKDIFFITRKLCRRRIKSVICHRDFHSRNILLHKGNLFIIDYQDIFLADGEYDLVSFIWDPYRDFKKRQIDILLEEYFDQSPDVQQREILFYYGLQRLLKCLGTYLHFGIIRNKKRYQVSIPSAVEKIYRLSNNLNLELKISDSIHELLNLITEIYKSEIS